jgi:CRISPR system Cascade subunit CasA
LVDRPWILVQQLDGRVVEVSLAEVFVRSHQFRAIVGEVPTQTLATVRLLLAILHRSVEGPETLKTWAGLWVRPTLPTSDIVAYLNHFRDRFDLLHPDMPFYQVAGLRTAKNEVFGLDRLIADVPNGEPYFTTRLKAGIARTSFAEAARWLVHCQAFDPSGIKSGAVGDERVKNGKGYPIGVGWAGMLGGLLVEGRSLRETLLLNLIPEDVTKPDHRDVPVWEREPQTAAEDTSGGRPYGPLELYTWQSRRIRLFADADGVCGVVIANGDKLGPQNMLNKEPMSAWRRSSAQEKKLGKPLVYMPREHDPERAMWRGLEALLPGRAQTQHGSDAATFVIPAVLKWIGRAQYEGLLEPGYQVRARAIGMRYGSQQATTEEIVDDAVSMSVVLLTEDDRELGATAIDAAGDAEAGAQALGNLAASLAEAAGGNANGPRQRAREAAYAELDGPFRAWLAGLGPDFAPRVERARWQRAAHEIIRELGASLIDQAGPAAWIGREVNERHVSAPEADLWFRRQLRKAFELAYEQDSPNSIGVPA